MPCPLTPQVGANNQHTVDFMAAGIVLVMSLLLSLGVRESAAFISGGWEGGTVYPIGSREQLGGGVAVCWFAGGGVALSTDACNAAVACTAVEHGAVDHRAAARSAGAHTDAQLAHAGVTVFKVVLIVFISIVGYTQGTFSTYNPPYAYSFGTNLALLKHAAYASGAQRTVCPACLRHSMSCVASARSLVAA